MQRLEVSGAVRPIYGSLGVKRLSMCGAILLLPHLFMTYTRELLLTVKRQTCDISCIYFRTVASPLVTSSLEEVNNSDNHVVGFII